MRRTRSETVAYVRKDDGRVVETPSPQLQLGEGANRRAVAREDGSSRVGMHAAERAEARGGERPQSEGVGAHAGREHPFCPPAAQREARPRRDPHQREDREQAESDDPAGDDGR